MLRLMLKALHLVLSICLGVTQEMMQARDIGLWVRSGSTGIDGPNRGLVIPVVCLFPVVVPFVNGAAPLQLYIRRHFRLRRNFRL